MIKQDCDAIQLVYTGSTGEELCHVWSLPWSTSSVITSSKSLAYVLKEWSSFWSH